MLELLYQNWDIIAAFFTGIFGELIRHKMKNKQK